MNKVVVTACWMGLASGFLFAQGGSPQPANIKEHKIPFIYCSDLFHPAKDPDDHFDLVTVFAMRTFDLKAVILDNHIDRPKQDQETGGGRIPLSQMMAITGKKVPWAIGLKAKLKTREDKALDADATCQGGVRLMLSVLRNSPEKVVLKLSTGADFAAAFNREPDLVRSKVRAVYLHAGNGSGGQQSEYNVTLDPIAYERVFETGVPVYWCPCFEGKPFSRFKHGYETFFNIPNQKALMDVCAPRVQRFFAYAFARSKEDPIQFLTAQTPIKLPGGVRSMWSTPTLAHAAGLHIYRRGADDYVFLTPERAAQCGLAGSEVKPFEFIPVRVTPTRKEEANPPADNPQPGTLGVDYAPTSPNANLFRQTDPAYAKILNSCLINLFREIGR